MDQLVIPTNIFIHSLHNVYIYIYFFFTFFLLPIYIYIYIYIYIVRRNSVLIINRQLK